MASHLPEAGAVVGGKYVIEKVLGQGGMGAVYVAQHQLTGKRLALKILLPELAGGESAVKRFMQEAQIAGRVQHRHVVDVFDMGRDGDALYMVMELLEGKTLTELLQDESLSLKEALLILVRAMEGVAAAHAQGVIHRDLKPDNIYVCVGPSGRFDDPRVLDFGISKVQDASELRTQSGMILGTPLYMSMEQLSAERDLDARVDVYSMGVILYEAIAGVLPFEAPSVSALAVRIISTEPLPLSAHRSDLPSGLSEVVMRAIARKREDRYPSMRALIDALQPFVPESAGLALPRSEAVPLRTPRNAAGRVASDPTMKAQPALIGAPTSMAPASDLASSQGSATRPMAHGLVVPEPTPAASTRVERTTPWVGLGVLTLVLAASGLWWVLRDREVEVPPPVPAQVKAPAPSAVPTPAAAAKAGRAAPSTAPIATEAPVVEDPPSAPAPRAPGRARAPKPPGESAAPAEAKVRARAGQLDPSDF